MERADDGKNADVARAAVDKTLESRAVAGGIGGANSKVAEKRGKFFCQSGSSRDHVSLEGYRLFVFDELVVLKVLKGWYLFFNGTERRTNASGNSLKLLRRSISCAPSL